MRICDLATATYFTAVDNTVLCELLHPGREEEVSLQCSIAHARLAPGESSLPHRLRTSAEVYVILTGTGEMQIDGEYANVHPGQAIYIPPNAVQSIRNTGETELSFLCVVSPMWRAEDEELV